MINLYKINKSNSKNIVKHNVSSTQNNIKNMVKHNVSSTQNNIKNIIQNNIENNIKNNVKNNIEDSTQNNIKLISVFFIFIVSIIFISLSSSISIAYDRVGYESFDWYINDPPPTGEPNYPRARTTGYYYTLESDWPVWYSGEGENYKGTACRVPKSKMGFYEAVRCEGTGLMNDGSLISYTGIKPTKEKSKLISFERRLKYKTPPPRPRRTIAVVNKKSSPCYIPRYSRVYIKYPDPNNPHTGWYIAEDSGGGFKGKESYCKIDIFRGVGIQSGLGKNPTVSRKNRDSWPEVWVFPGKNTPDLKEDNILTYLEGSSSSNVFSNEIPDFLEADDSSKLHDSKPDRSESYDSGIPSSAYAGSSPDVGQRVSVLPSHPYFNVPYSINPSFSVDAPYDFGLYESISDKLSDIDHCKGNLFCINEELLRFEKESDGIDWIAKYAGEVISKNKDGESELSKWESFCEPSNLNKVTSLAEAMQTVAISQDSDCIFRVNLPLLKSEDDLSYETTNYVTESLTNLLGLLYFTKSEIVDLLGDLVIRFSTSKSGDYFTISDVDGKIPSQKVFGKFVAVDDSISPESNTDFIYPKDVDDLTVDIYKDKNRGLWLYPKDGAPSNLYCDINNKVVKFCIVQNTTVFAYDASTDKLGLQRLSVNFAYIFKNEVADVQNIELRDAKIAKNSIIISWDKLSGADISSYTIYYSNKSVTKNILSGLNPDVAGFDENFVKNVETFEFFIDSAVSIPSFNLDQSPNCIMYQESPVSCLPEYSVGSSDNLDKSFMTISPSTLYFDSSSKKYFVILSVFDDDKPISIAMTATDVDGIMSPSFNFPDDDLIQDSVGDLPSGIALVESIVDEKDIFSLVTYPVDYYLDQSYLNSELIDHFKIFCFADNQFDIDTTVLSDVPGKAVYEDSFDDYDDGSFMIDISKDKLTPEVCGYESLPAEVHLVVVPVIKNGLSELFYDGNVVEESSVSLVIPAPKIES